MNGHLIQVLLPLRLDWMPVYFSPTPLDKGIVVSVDFRNKAYYGIVWGEGSQDEGIDEDKINNILSSSTLIPSLSSEEMQLWEFISSYYMCSLGEVYKAARPLQNIRSAKIAVSRLERLNAKLDKIEIALSKKHKEHIRERLKGEKEKVSVQIAYLTGYNSLKGKELNSASAETHKALVIEGEDLTERYCAEIHKALQEKDAQILILTPEIAFCSRLEEKFREEFGELLMIVNSHKSSAQRYFVHQSLRNSEAAVVLGTRSAVFLPFRNLKLVIIDSEHEASFKQNEPAPRYNGRDVAVYLAGLFGAKILLGTSSPSFETIYNCKIGKYLLEKKPSEKGSDSQIIDIVSERRKNGMIGCLSRKLIAQIKAFDGKVILIRGWENTEELQKQCAELFSDSQVEIMTLREFKSRSGQKDVMLAFVQIDAFLSKDDFRSDEKAVQMLSTLSSLCSKLIIQTAVPSRFDGSRKIEDLLSERKKFDFPPFTRLVNIRSKADNSILRQYFLKRNSSLSEQKKQISSSLQAGEFPDVDPL